MVDATTARRLISPHGVTKTQDTTDWAGTFPLPSALEAFYRDVGPVDVTIDGPGNPFFLPSLAGLWKYQRGYRWDAASGQPAAGWDDDWLVVADEGADPFIFSRSRGIVLRARHGTGTWSPTEVFEDLNEMAACLGVIGSVIAAAGDALLDDDYDLRPEHVDSMTDQIAAVIGDEGRASAVVRSLGITT
jgi:hypothetical protein